MPRPYFRYSGEQLQELFYSSKDDPNSLRDLHAELEFRTRPKMVALRNKVKDRLVGISKLPPPPPSFRPKQINTVKTLKAKYKSMEKKSSPDSSLQKNVSPDTPSTNPIFNFFIRMWRKLWNRSFLVWFMLSKSIFSRVVALLLAFQPCLPQRSKYPVNHFFIAHFALPYC